jgi:hypothetical protein
MHISIMPLIPTPLITIPPNTTLLTFTPHTPHTTLKGFG